MIQPTWYMTRVGCIIPPVKLYQYTLTDVRVCWMMNNDQTTTKAGEKHKSKIPLSIATERIEEFLGLVDDTGLESVTSCV